MQQPNVVFVIADQHRHDFIGYQDGGATVTPHLDALAARGTVFDNAFCTSPLCSPSRAALACGRYGMNSGCYTNLHELPPNTPTFVRQLRDAGYRTCAVGKTHMAIHAYDADYTSTEHQRFMHSLGWDETIEISGNGMLRTGIRCAYSEFLREQGRLADVVRFYRQWHYFMDAGGGGDPPFVCHPWGLPEELQETTFVGETALRWLRDRDPDKPFFLHVGFAGPHSPTEPLPRFLELYSDRDEPPPWNCPSPPEWLPQARRGYRAMISQIDFWVGRLCDELERQGVLDNTIIIYTADHGEMAGDHGAFGKTCFFEGSIRIPLLFSGPGVLSGRSSDALVELIDIGATVCELCGVDAHDSDQGKSLVPMLSGAAHSHRETVYAEMGCDRMIFDGRYKLMWGDPRSDTRRLGRLHLDKPVTIPPSPCRLYDLCADPHESQDLASDPRSAPILAEMKDRLVARINENLQPRPFLDRGEYRPLEV